MIKLTSASVRLALAALALLSLGVALTPPLRFIVTGVVWDAFILSLYDHLELYRIRGLLALLIGAAGAYAALAFVWSDGLEQLTCTILAKYLARSPQARGYYRWRAAVYRFGQGVQTLPGFTSSANHEAQMDQPLVRRLIRRLQRLTLLALSEAVFSDRLSARLVITLAHDLAADYQRLLKGGSAQNWTRYAATSATLSAHLQPDYLTPPPVARTVAATLLADSVWRLAERFKVGADAAHALDVQAWRARAETGYTALLRRLDEVGSLGEVAQRFVVFRCLCLAGEVGRTEWERVGDAYWTLMEDGNTAGPMSHAGERGAGDDSITVALRLAATDAWLAAKTGWAEVTGGDLAVIQTLGLSLPDGPAAPVGGPTLPLEAALGIRLGLATRDDNLAPVWSADLRWAQAASQAGLMEALAHTWRGLDRADASATSRWALTGALGAVRRLAHQQGPAGQA